MKIVDLHVHSNKSDGTFSPRELVDYAIEKGLSAFALTDHDTASGIKEAMDYAASLRQSASTHNKQSIPEVIPGIELSTEYEGRDIHIVGLYIDYKNPAFLDKLQTFVNSRTTRNYRMCELLREAGIDISYEQLQEANPDAVITRAHYARYMFDHGHVNSLAEAFDRYIGDHAPCFVPREKVTPAQGIHFILEAKGIPVLAHPLLYRMGKARLEALVAQLKIAGLLALECVYSTYNTSEERQMRTMAAKYHLLPSGGSDFHGSNKPGLDLAVGYGKLFIPVEILDNLKKARKNLLFTDMDGTLLRKDSTVSDEMREAVRALSRAGHRLILASGRPLPSILEVQKQQGLYHPGAIVIAYNGALIYNCSTKKSIVSHRLSMEDLHFVTREAEKLGIHVHTYTNTSIVAKEYTKELEYYTKRIHLPVLLTEDFGNVLRRGPYKVQCICLNDRGKLEVLRQVLDSHSKGRFQVAFSSDTYLEILPLAAGKGNAIQAVYEELHIPHTHTFAAGDEENDISMLQAACHGIAMANATNQVKMAADFVTTKTNDEDGLLEVLQKYFI